MAELRPDEAVRRWLASYNSDGGFSEENFDDDMFSRLHYDADQETRLAVAFELSRQDPTKDARGFLGAGTCEDLLADAPELLPRIKELARQEPRFRETIGYAWATGAMSEEAKAFLKDTHDWMEREGIGR